MAIIQVKAQEFSELKNPNIDSIYYGALNWGDYDNDNDLDILITGITKDYNIVSKIYKNNGNDSFEEQKDIHLMGLFKSSCAFGDYNNDNRLDVIITGRNSGNFTKIYKNNGDGTYSEQTNVFLSGGEDGKLNWGDYDNDGFLDLIIVGQDSDCFTKIYKNNGDNSFTEQTEIQLPKLKKAAAEWGDYDNDGDLDFILSGQDSAGLGVSIIYKNTNHSFIKQSQIELMGLYNGSVKWEDYNKDKKLDLLITGKNGNKRYSKIYKNCGNDTFEEQRNIVLDGIEYGSAEWGDYNNDGFPDILLTGYSDNGRISKIYKNNGDNTFSEQTNIHLSALRFSDSKWGDYDNDGDLDIMLSGQDENNNVIFKIYKNNIVNHSATSM
jgi:hypothetical protein